MKTKYFTIADGPYFGYMAKILAEQLKKSHDIDLVILHDGLAKVHGCMSRQYWLKAYLWDFAETADRIMYFDSDILLINRLSEEVIQCEASFAARLDVPSTGINQRAQHRHFSTITDYFNNGFFIANRDSIKAFEMLKEQKDNPIHASCIEQTWMNRIVDDLLYPYHILPSKVCWMPKGEIKPDGDISMIHYAGWTPADKLVRFLRDKEKYNV